MWLLFESRDCKAVLRWGKSGTAASAMTVGTSSGMVTAVTETAASEGLPEVEQEPESGSELGAASEPRPRSASSDSDPLWSEDWRDYCGGW
jgi:hypothetical protein